MEERLEMSSEYRALLDAVLDRPDDDFPRLAMADWLAENGYDDDNPPFSFERNGRIYCLWHRGFIYRIACTLANFLEHAEWIANNWPVNEVNIMDITVRHSVRMLLGNEHGIGSRIGTAIDYNKLSIDWGVNVPNQLLQDAIHQNRGNISAACLQYLRELRTRRTVTA